MNPVILFKRPRLKSCWLSLFLVVFITACDPFSQTSSLEKIQKRHEIIMGTINGSLTYSYEGSQYSGFDYELGNKFANYLNVELRVKEYDSLKALFRALRKEEIDFIGAGLTLTPKRIQKYRSSPPYYTVSQTVVYHKGTYRPRKITDVKEPIAVLKNSSHEETLQALQARNPNLEIEAQENEDQESLLRKVANKEIKFALVDSSTLAQKQRYYPVLAEAFTLSEELPVAWLIKRDLDNTLYSAMIEFIGNKYQDQTITKLREKYFGHVENFDFVDTKIFLKRIASTLPQYEVFFKKYTTPEVDWPLLAAVSYQESHWNPKARSPTGVRGMMMLTRDTAKYLGIKNRLDTKQSIEGGARYLSQLIKRLPESIANDEKVWFALASYNIGYGHLMDARRITVMKKQDPNSWTDVKDNLPLLHQKKWYKKTRYGYARGKEALHYVNNIRQYRKTLSWVITEREKKEAEIKEAEVKALQVAKDKVLAEQHAQVPLNKEQALQVIQETILAQEKALQISKIKTIEIEKVLEISKEKALAEDKSIHLTETHLAALQQALKQTAEKALATQKTFQVLKEEIFAEQKVLQQAKEKTLLALEKYQQAKESALTELQIYQQSKDRTLAEQQAYQEAKNKALKQQEELIQIINHEPQTQEASKIEDS